MGSGQRSASARRSASADSHGGRDRDSASAPHAMDAGKRTAAGGGAASDPFDDAPSPPSTASNISTSEGEGSADEDVRRSAAANASLVDETAGDMEDDEDAEDGESSPEVKCMWEDCGEVFNSLVSFINHLHEGAYPVSRERAVLIYRPQGGDRKKVS